MLIRRATSKDARGIHLVHMRSIRELCSKDHSPEEIKAWGHRPFNLSHRLDAIKNDSVWVIDGNGIEGYAHMRLFSKDGIKRAHIMGLYLSPDIVGKSMGRKLFEALQSEMQEHKVEICTLESTITAQKFYLKIGFEKSGPESSINLGGVPIRCFPMKMSLNY